MVDYNAILAWAAIIAIGVSVIDLIMRSRKDRKLLQKLQSDIDTQRQAITVLGTIAKAQKKAVKIQKDRLDLEAGIAFLKAAGVLDKDGALVVNVENINRSEGT
jgi:hypothetical protein